MKIDRQKDLYFYQLILSNVLAATDAGEIYEVATNRFLNKKYREGFYRRLSYKSVTIQAHRFVWMYFNGLIPKDLQINHIDGKKHNNSKDNLEIVTNAQNTQHAYDNGLTIISEETKKMRSEKLLGEKNVNAKLTNEQVIIIRQQYLNKEITSSRIQEVCGLSRRAVENMLLGRSYINLPFVSKKLHTSSRASLLKEDIIEIRQLYFSKAYTQKEIGKLFNVSRSTVKDIVTYRTYKNI